LPTKALHFTRSGIWSYSIGDDAGTSARGIGGLAVLWSDPDVFSSHTESGGNALMMATIEIALQAALTVDW